MTTPLENALIKAVAESCFRDSDDLRSPVWLPTPDECGFTNKKTLSGVVSSLTEKGIVQTQGTGNDITIWLSKEGVEIYNKVLN